MNPFVKLPQTGLGSILPAVEDAFSYQINKLINTAPSKLILVLDQQLSDCRDK
jgi:hypothetical protein